MNEPNAPTIQYFSNRISELRHEKEELTKTLEKYDKIVPTCVAIWSIVFGNDNQQEEKVENGSRSELPSYMNIDKLRQEFSNRMMELSELRERSMKLINRESELLIKLGDCQKQLNQYKMHCLSLRRELTKQRLNNRRSMIDPLINYNYESILNEKFELNSKLEAMNDELLINDFNVESIAGRHLINKCKKLLIENHSIGNQLNNCKNSRINEELQLIKIHNANLTNHLLDSQMQIRSLHQEIESIKRQHRQQLQQLQEVQQRQEHQDRQQHENQHQNEHHHHHHHQRHNSRNNKHDEMIDIKLKNDENNNINTNENDMDNEIGNEISNTDENENENENENHNDNDNGNDNENETEKLVENEINDDIKNDNIDNLDVNETNDINLVNDVNDVNDVDDVNSVHNIKPIEHSNEIEIDVEHNENENENTNENEIHSKIKENDDKEKEQEKETEKEQNLGEKTELLHENINDDQSSPNVSCKDNQDIDIDIDVDIDIGVQDHGNQDQSDQTT